VRAAGVQPRAPGLASSYRRQQEAAERTRSLPRPTSSKREERAPSNYDLRILRAPSRGGGQNPTGDGVNKEARTVATTRRRQTACPPTTTQASPQGTGQEGNQTADRHEPRATGSEAGRPSHRPDHTKAEQGEHTREGQSAEVRTSMNRTVKAKTPRSSPLPSHRSRSRRASSGLALCHAVSGGVPLSLLGRAAAASSASAAAPPRIPVFGSPVPFRAGSRSCFAAGFGVFAEGLAGASPCVFPTRLAARRRWLRARDVRARSPSLLAQWGAWLIARRVRPQVSTRVEIRTRAGR
jgi:hypothetical protein